MSDLPKDPYDRTVIIPATLDVPDRAGNMGSGRSFVVNLTTAAETPGAENMFLSRTGRWVNFASTELNAWGSIIGNIQDQADLWNELQIRPLTTDISAVGLNGQWAAILNKPLFGDVSLINTTGATSQFLRADGSWAIPVDVNAEWGNIGGILSAQTDLQAALNLKANTANPTLTGLVQVPLRPVDDNGAGAASTAWFFGQAFDGAPVMDGAASSGDSLRWARGNHRHPSDTSRAPLDSPSLTGIPLSTTPVVPDNSTRIATTAFVNAAINAAGLTPPPSDGQIYGFMDGGWVVLSFATKWDRT